jgi:hypothetical protein
MDMKGYFILARYCGIDLARRFSRYGVARAVCGASSRV